MTVRDSSLGCLLLGHLGLQPKVLRWLVEIDAPMEAKRQLISLDPQELLGWDATPTRIVDAQPNQILNALAVLLDIDQAARQAPAAEARHQANSEPK